MSISPRQGTCFTRGGPAGILSPVIATVVNCISVIIGSVIGVTVHNRIGERFREVVFTGIGLISLIVGIQMALATKQILYVALSLVVGGILGDRWDIEGAVLRFGEWLRHLVTVGAPKDVVGRSAVVQIGKGDVVKPSAEEATATGRNEHPGRFAEGFLSASVLFCVGAMTLIGAFQAGAEGDYTLILTKSVMDGFMAIMLAAAMGIGVMFSVIVILVYQGGLTVLAGLIGPVVNSFILAEISGVGGILVMMIGLNLLDLKKIKTANFLPGLGLVVLLALADPYLRQAGSFVQSLVLASSRVA